MPDPDVLTHLIVGASLLSSDGGQRLLRKSKISNNGDRWRLPMQLGEIHHNKLEPLKDPRVDELTASDYENPTIEEKQDDLPLK
jgi:hypothetical protein